MSPPLVINFAPTGMVPTKAMTPHAPLSVEEILADVRAAWELGITVAHLHARDAAGRPTHDPGVYSAIIRGVRAFAPDLVICASLSGRDDPRLESRIAPLSLEGPLKPDMGSLTLSSLNFPKQASCSDPEVVHRLAEEMRRRGILPELEVFDLGMAHYAGYLERKGLLAAPHYANVILGNIASAQVDPLHLGILVRELPPSTLWCVGGIGRSQLSANLLGVALGGGVRVGLEDNLYLDDEGGRLATNLALLQRIHALAAAAGRPIMTPAEFRRRLALAPGHGAYGRAPQP